jgi:apolipoprotein D and lipocalin family protein
MSSSIFFVPVLLSFCSCATIPHGAKVVSPFDFEKYLGTWYEIARFDFRFERNMNNVTATYSFNENGTIKVDNRGYNYITKEWNQAIGKAKFAGSKDEAKLKVSFFGPFYAAYNVIAIDTEYKYALVVGKNLKFMWILSREKSIPENVKRNYLEIATGLGFDVSNLIWTEQDN